MKNSIHRPKHLIHKSLKFGPIGLCALLAILANKADAATSQYFGVTAGIANGGTYSWDAANWSVSGGTSSGPFASDWTAGDFARFYGGSGDTYTVTVNVAESFAGVFDDAATANTLTIADAGNGTGSLSLTPDTSQASQNGFSWLTQGFLTSTSTVTITAPITGTGGVEEESGGGHLQMYGNNSFTGGYLVTSSSTFNDYNNNNSFGAITSQIGFDGTTFSIMNNTGPSSVNIANPLQTIGASGINFIGNSVTYSGNWYLGGGSTANNIRNNGVGTTVTLSGVLSGTTGAVTYSGANGGTILLGAQNTYTGPTTVGVTGDTAITLQLGVANAIATSSSLTLAGGTLNPGGFAQAMTGPLGMTASSKIDFTAGAAAVSFANSSSTAWTGVLNLINFSYGDLEFGNSSSDLSTAQLADIEFNGANQGAAALDANGFLVELPEPSTYVLGLVGGLGMLWIARRRTA